MPDNTFADPRLARLYDPSEGSRPDLDGYLNIVDELGARSVLDLGCGTGTLACLLAERGIEVIGVDPAEASLDIARNKRSAEQVRWVHGDIAAVDDVSVDCAVMTGNVAQVFVSDEGWRDVLTGLHLAIRPHGYLVFEVRDPADCAWHEWTREQSHTFIDVDDVGLVETWVDLVELASPLVTFRWTYRFIDRGDELYSSSTLRFRERVEIEESLEQAGFTLEEVRDAPDRPNKEFVFIVRRSG